LRSKRAVARSADSKISPHLGMDLLVKSFGSGVPEEFAAQSAGGEEGNEDVKLSPS